MLRYTLALNVLRGRLTNAILIQLYVNYLPCVCTVKVCDGSLFL